MVLGRVETKPLDCHAAAELSRSWRALTPALPSGVGQGPGHGTWRWATRMAPHEFSKSPDFTFVVITAPARRTSEEEGMDV